VLIKRSLLVVLLAALALPLTAWSFAKPVRLLVPELNGVTCSDSVCVDDAGRMLQAKALYEAAHEHVSAKLTPLTDRPLMVFCSTATCYRSFGGGSQRAITYPKIGSLIAPSSWAPHFARHELIHALQAQELGAMRMMRGPEWFREGMAYSVSEPPAHDMPPQFQTYRAQYEAWVIGVEAKDIWSATAKL
jgi:hypothetical protein